MLMAVRNQIGRNRRRAGGQYLVRMRSTPADSKPSDDFEDLFVRQYWPVRDFVRRRAPETVVEDLVSEVFLVAWRRFADIRGDPLPWLLGVARRVMANHWRAEGRRTALIQRVQRATSQADTSWEAPGGMDVRLAAALGRLTEHDRSALLLVAWEGLDPTSGGRVLGCTPTAFSARVHRARRRLAEELSAVSNPSKALTKEIPS
jgi:RNA polymerase sigma-70 factor (ECF subfamily)